MKFPYFLLKNILNLIPKSIRDFCYKKFAEYRYKIFGKID
jgi:predicted DCC family thiol-disulfide oxidoreductase YuxK